MGKISVDAFLKQYSVAAKQKGSAMEDFMKKHIITDYIDYLTKDTMCTNIVTATTRIKNGDRTILRIDSSAQFMLFIMNLINSYTDIEIEFKDTKFVKQYDALNKVGAIDDIVQAIPKKEYSEFSTLLNMKMDDFRDNEYSVTALLNNLKQSFSLSEEVINSVIDELQKQAKEEIKKESNEEINEEIKEESKVEERLMEQMSKQN